MLDRAPFRREVAAAIAADATPRAVALAQRFAQAGQQQLDGDPRPPEHDRLAAGAQERECPALGQRHGRAARAARRARGPAGRPAGRGGPGGGPVAVDEPRRSAGQHRRQLARVPDRRRAADDDRPRAVVGADPEQPAQDVGDMAAEHAAVGVQLVDDDDPELLEQLEPLGVVGEDRRVEHVRVGDHDLAGGPDRRTDRGGRVAVVGRGRGPTSRRLPRGCRTPPPGPGRAPWSGTGTAPAPPDRRRSTGGPGPCSTATCPRRWASRRRRRCRRGPPRSPRPGGRTGARCRARRARHDPWV